MLDAFLEHPFFLIVTTSTAAERTRVIPQTPCSNLPREKALRNISSELLHVVRLLKLKEMRDVSLEGIAASGARLGARATHESQGAFIR